jgi:hypothetical protein
MPYIGKSPVGGGFHKLDNLTASATDTYALTLGSAAYFPETANQLLVSLNGVIQAPQDSFTVSGSNLVFDSALTASDSIDFVVALGDVLGVGSVTDGAVTTAKIANQAVTMNKLATSGTLPALDGSNLTGVGVTGISSSSTNGTALSIDANNIVTTPARPMFHAYGSGGWTVFSNGSFSRLDLDQTTFNQGSHYSTSTYKFSAPVAGVYHFYYMVYARIQSGGSSSAYWTPRFRKNGNNITGNTSMIMGFTYQGAGNEETATYSSNILLAANDEITLHVQAQNSSHNGEYYKPSCTFGGHLIG